jgi:hypothetical protein
MLQKKTSSKKWNWFLWREGELNSRPSADGYEARAMLQKKTSSKKWNWFLWREGELNSRPSADGYESQGFKQFY